MDKAGCDIVIVGIGNPYRCDDAAGWAVIDNLTKMVGSSVPLLKTRGDLAEMLDLFAAHKTVLVVDACQGLGSAVSPASPWQRIDVIEEMVKEDNFLTSARLTSTHGFSVAEAISMAKHLDQLPDKLILYLINGEHYELNDRLSPAVLKGVDLATQAIFNEEEIQACMNKA